ncbi:ACT domain-containing protein [Hymenobacter jejuensis]|uniref:ACT domain-containing protein n=1 Tax=Hymenobacter jejuensis TaxID=2502781 RepID=A0A5B8A5P3_9BACT|nr:ACT domain-containing protein [Hymenobacter jejuensis]QDA62557.1 ACT domain-containing protein [Hymenobacter jejuensis]
MGGEMNLSVLLMSMQPILREEEFVFCTTRNAPSTALQEAICWFREEEGSTLILTRAQADAAQLSYASAFRMITLAVHSSLEAVGFLAAVTGKLAANSISVNTVSAYYHDHLFIPIDRAAEAMEVLWELSRNSLQE